MDTVLQQLKDALQTLALSITAQVQLDKNEVGRVERFRKKFQIRHCLIQAEMDYQLTKEQKKALAQLDNMLFYLNPSTDWLYWPEDKLRSNAAWRKVRAYAREALVQFKWPLELPYGVPFDYPSNDQDTCLEEEIAMNHCFT